MGLIVQKFGGSSVKDRNRIFNVARIVMNTRNAGNDVVVVVSAQGDTTDDLIAKAAEITSDPSHREMDMLLAAGEEISISLLAMALQELGVSAISLTGWQAGFNTDRAYSKARIKRLDTERVESELAHLMFAIPACKGIEFGAGFGFAALRGSEANDPFTMRGGEIATATNKNGGVNGGITNGMPLVFRTVLKPTPSIYKEQHTVDYISRQDAELQIRGRHDPCIVPRAAVVQNTLTAFGLLDLLTVRYGTLAQKHGLPQA